MHTLETPARVTLQGFDNDHCLHDEGSADEGWINGAGPCMHTPVVSGACAKLTMIEATRPGLVWLLLFCPADVAVPSVLYGSSRGTHQLCTNNVVMSSMESCFSRRQCSHLTGQFLGNGRLPARCERGLRLSL